MAHDQILDADWLLAEVTPYYSPARAIQSLNIFGTYSQMAMVYIS